MQVFNLHQATMNDFDTVYDMALKFAKAYSPHWNEDSIKDLVATFLSNTGDKICIVCPGKGMLAAVISPFMLDMRLTMATEVAWWVEPEDRMEGLGEQLLSAFEFWAASIGCNLITMVALSDPLGAYYEKNGYTLHERAYIKEIK